MVEAIPCKPGVWSVFHKDEGGKVAAPTMGIGKRRSYDGNYFESLTLPANAVKSELCTQNYMETETTPLSVFVGVSCIRSVW